MLFEGLEQGDLKRLVHPELHIDEFKSKLGRDEDVCVVSFKVTGKEPATDLVNFIEKGYEWVIDADVSSGEMDDGDYIVFVECERDRHIPQNIVTMMEDLMNVTGQKVKQWRVRYYKDQTDHSLDIASLKELVPQTPEEYAQRYGTKDLDKLKSAAGVKVTTKAPKNDTTESLRIAAGIL
jgi:hypothetical protein